MATTYTYPFDPTGAATTNAVANERHVLSPPAWKDFYFIVPKFAPYFRDSLRVIHRPSGKLLVEGVDYHCTHYFHAASHGVARRVYGSITLLDKTLLGVLEINYQTIGGDWVLDASADLTRLTNTLTNPRITTWEEVVDVPYQFPPIDHQWDLEDLKGVEAILPILNEMTEAIRDSAGGSFNLHIADKNNPHAVTKDQVGLDQVQNLPLANIAEAQAGVLNTRYMTPVRTKNFVDSYLIPILDAHKNDLNNPHGTTKTQIGLGLVQNYGMATQAEAEAGLATNKYMTPLQTKQAIAALAVSGLPTHLADLNNPHQVTKAQVGLTSVQDYGIATTAEAEAATRNDRYMTPLATAKQIQVLVKDSMDLHLNSTSNPHATTKTQVGLSNVQNYAVATQAEAEAGAISTAYMTPLMTRKAIEAIAVGSVGAHLADMNNPHATTKAQVGLSVVENYSIANTTEAQLGQSDTRYMTPLGVKTAIDAQVGSTLTSHVASVANPHGVTKTQVGLSNVQNFGIATQAAAEAGLVSTVYMTPLLTAQAITAQALAPLNTHIANIANPHATTAAQVGTYSSAVLDGKFDAKLGVLSMAADSSGLEGHTYADVLNAAKAQGTVNSDKLENQTLAQVLAQAKAQTADNSLKLGGKTSTEITNELVAALPYTKQLRVPDFALANDATVKWIPLCMATPVVNVDIDDISIMFNGLIEIGGRSLSGLINVNPTSLTSSVTILSGHVVDLELFYTNVGGTFRLWYKTTSNDFASTALTLLSGKNFTSLEAGAVVTGVAPSGTVAIPMVDVAPKRIASEFATVAAGANKEYDLQTLLGASHAAFDKDAARVSVRVKDVAGGSPTLNMYINSETSSIVTAIRANRYVRVLNSGAGSADLHIRIDVPRLP